MIGYIKRDTAAKECERLHAINSGFFSNLIKQLPDEDFWIDANTNPPKESGMYIATITLNEHGEDKFYTDPVAYFADENVWNLFNCQRVEVLYWMEFPKPKTPTGKEA